MNELHRELFDDLVELTRKERGVFYYSDDEVQGEYFRVFSYRLIPHYEKWMVHKSAVEARGITFEIDPHTGKPLRLASWPFEKFFNLNENPLATGLDLSNPREILIKEDGSLISSMLLSGNGDLYLKSKASLTSKQADAANKLIRSPDCVALYDWVLSWTRRNYTVIMEFISPFNQIVVPYSETSLKVLAIRKNENGAYVDLDQVEVPGNVQTYIVENLAPRVHSVESFIESVASTTNLEGYVIRLASGQRVKVKTDWYRNQHKNAVRPKTKDLVMAILEDKVDDLFCGMEITADQKKIDRITADLVPLYNETVQTTTEFHERNKTMAKKHFFLKAKAELTPLQLGLVMRLYAGDNIDFSNAVYSYLKKRKMLERYSIVG